MWKGEVSTYWQRPARLLNIGIFSFQAANTWAENTERWGPSESILKNCDVRRLKSTVSLCYLLSFVRCCLLNFQGNSLVAVWADAMAEQCVGVFRNIVLDALPIILFISDLLAVGTDR